MLPDFLKQKLKSKKGKIIKISNGHSNFKTDNIDREDFVENSKKYKYKVNDGEIIGEHNGAHFFTIGQRKGLNLGGYKEPLFVIDTDVIENIIYVGEGKSHPGLYRKALEVSKNQTHWIRNDLKLSEGENLEISARIRYRQTLQKATLHQTKTGMFVAFEKPQSAITSGQFVAWYLGNELVGSGVIY